jgi:hypothetical protein
MVSGLVDGMRGIRAWKILIRIPPLLMHIAHIIPNACQARVFNCDKCLFKNNLFLKRDLGVLKTQKSVLTLLRTASFVVLRVKFTAGSL